MGPALRGFCFVLWRGIRTAGARVGRSRGHLCPPPARPRARGPCDSRRRQCQRFSLPRPPPACPGLSGRGFHSVRKTPSPAVAESGSKAVTRVAPSGFQKPGLCVHRADGAGHCASLCPCDHWVVIWSVLVSCPWVGGRRGRGQGETGPADVGGSGPVRRMSCVERPRSPNPLPTFQVLRVADGWLPATHVLRSPIQPPHLVPPKMIKLFLTIFLMREHISR